MSLAPWRSPLSRAIHLNRSLPYSRYFQLATVREDGLPANRTVVFRGFFPDTDRLQIVTDSRSDKIAQINYQPWAEICWYFPKTREQFRLAGQLILVKADSSDTTLQKARQTAWQKLSDSARSQFAWPDPGKPRVENEEGFSPSFICDREPLPNFCLLLLDPVKVDRLELKGEPQNRCIYLLKEGSWSTEEVNP